MVDITKPQFTRVKMNDIPDRTRSGYNWDALFTEAQKGDPIQISHTRDEISPNTLTTQLNKFHKEQKYLNVKVKQRKVTLKSGKEEIYAYVYREDVEPKSGGN